MGDHHRRRDVVVNRRKSGELYHEELTITPVAWADGRRGYVGVKADASHREALARLAASTCSAAWRRRSPTDTGCGIAPELLPRIFDPFFTTKKAGLGTGLGLPTVRRIVEGLGGKVAVATQLKRGTTFTLFLPA